jgi:hypothetical protein
MQEEHQLSEREMQLKGRKVLLLMLVFFAVPIIVVIMMYQLNWKPTGESIGELVTPARLINSVLELQDSSGKKVEPQFWQERWSIVYVADECEQQCMGKLHDMRQLHVSLYKDMMRAQRVLLTTTQDVSKIKSDYPDMIIINQPVVNLGGFAQQFQIGQENAATSNRLYLVDPLGHLMMSYRQDVPLADVRKDVTRLLRYSWAG